MHTAEIFNIISQHDWWEEKFTACWQLIALPMHCFIEQTRYFHPSYLTITIIANQQGFFHELTPEDEKYEIYKYIYEKTKRDPRYLIKKRSRGDRAKTTLNTARQVAKQMSRLSNRKMWQGYNSVIKNYLEYLRYAVLPECYDIVTAYHLEGLVREALPKVSQDTLWEVMRMMVSPAEHSFMDKERILFLELCLSLPTAVKRQRTLSAAIIVDVLWRKKLFKLSRSYFWFANSFKETHYKTADEYLREIVREAKRRHRSEIRRELSGLRNKVERLRRAHRRLQKKYKFSPELRRHFFIGRLCGAWIDARKQFMLQMNHYLILYSQELSRRFDIPLVDVKTYLLEDLKNLLLHGKKVSAKTLRARRQRSLYIITKHGQRAKATMLYGDRARKIYHAFTTGRSSRRDTIHGQTASAPVKRLSGTAEVILDMQKQHFTDGRILVTSMTRPEFIPALRRARAVITDEGGLTSHAAIVSREMGIPCIIGTKIATNVIRTGDKIRLDTTEGVITILSRK